MKRILLGLVLLALAMTACGPQMGEGPTELPNDVETAIKDTVSGEENVAPEDLEVVDVEQREWSDACLGLAEPGEMCAQVITPGWKVTLRGGGETYVVHANEDGTAIRIE
jgi:predicted small lipoprotein YifL